MPQTAVTREDSFKRATGLARVARLTILTKLNILKKIKKNI